MNHFICLGLRLIVWGAHVLMIASVLVREFWVYRGSGNWPKDFKDDRKIST